MSLWPSVSSTALEDGREAVAALRSSRASSNRRPPRNRKCRKSRVLVGTIATQPEAIGTGSGLLVSYTLLMATQQSGTHACPAEKSCFSFCPVRSSSCGAGAAAPLACVAWLIPSGWHRLCLCYGGAENGLSPARLKVRRDQGSIACGQHKAQAIQFFRVLCLPWSPRFARAVSRCNLGKEQSSRRDPTPLPTAIGCMSLANDRCWELSLELVDVPRRFARYRQTGQ